VFGFEVNALHGRQLLAGLRRPTRVGGAAAQAQ